MEVKKIEYSGADYEISLLQTLLNDKPGALQVGVVSFNKDKRSPDKGMGINPQHEIAFILEGRFIVETKSGLEVISTGDVVTSDPNEAHAVRALEDGRILFVLYGEEARF